jgi:hypothetical protein
MTAKSPENNENVKINKNYVPSEYKHIEAILDKKSEEMLEQLYGKDWYKIINGKLSTTKEK